MISRAIIPTRHLVKSIKNIKNVKNVKKEKVKNTKEKKTFVYDKSKEDRNTFLL
jgi:hypothetical protein